MIKHSTDLIFCHPMQRNQEYISRKTGEHWRKHDLIEVGTTFSMKEALHQFVQRRRWRVTGVSKPSITDFEFNVVDTKCVLFVCYEPPRDPVLSCSYGWQILLLHQNYLAPSKKMLNVPFWATSNL